MNLLPLLLVLTFAPTVPATCDGASTSCAAVAPAPFADAAEAELEAILAEIAAGDAATCGASRGTFDVGRMTFDRKVLGADHPVVVEFWATWCAPCKRLAPVLEAVADEMDGKARVARVNVDTNGALARRLGVSRVPTVLLFHGGEELRRTVGAVSRDTLVSWIDRALAPRG